MPADRYWGAETQLSLIHFDIGISGALDDHFPLFVWQTGSGTQSNMNVNEVISNRCLQIVERAGRWADVVKIGRTHLQDAVPLTVGQEWSGWAAQLDTAAARVERGLDELMPPATGGTAVGTGLNAPPGFGAGVAAEIARLTKSGFVSAPIKFEAQGSLDGIVACSATLRGVAVTLMKIANDIRWLAWGPRAGMGELRLPANEPGNSIMPGKVNPTQREAMVMVCIQVLGDDTAVGVAGSHGNFELNAMRPIVINDVLHSARIPGCACTKLRQYCIAGVELHTDRISADVDRSLMLVTALSPCIGYDRASAIADDADRTDSTSREAALRSGFVSADDFDRIVDPRRMVGLTDVTV